MNTLPDHQLGLRDKIQYWIKFISESIKIRRQWVINSGLVSFYMIAMILRRLTISFQHTGQSIRETE